MIHGVTFDNQTPTAKNHGALFRGILSDGILSGCAISYVGAALSIGVGYIMAAGRMFQITAAETVNASRTNGYARLKAVLNMSGTATTAEFSQVSFALDYASSVSGFSALTQEDINNAGTKYEVSLGIFSLGSGGIIAQTALGSISQTVIASNQISSENIKDAAITGMKIGNNQITGGKLAANAVTREKMGTLTLKSGVDYFASEAARNSAIPNPVTGQITWIKV